VGAENRSRVQLLHFLSEFILTHTTEITTTPRTPTTTEDLIRPEIKALAEEGAVDGNTENIGS
jgi:hypothetical protein